MFYLSSVPVLIRKSYSLSCILELRVRSNIIEAKKLGISIRAFCDEARLIEAQRRLNDRISELFAQAGIQFRDPSSVFDISQRLSEFEVPGAANQRERLEVILANLNQNSTESPWFQSAITLKELIDPDPSSILSENSSSSSEDSDNEDLNLF